jgi:hypothetical protein
MLCGCRSNSSILLFQTCSSCASNLRPGKPIFFASDHKHASVVAKEYGIWLNSSIVTHQSNPDPPLHMDKIENTSSRPASDYYDTFVDLYLLAFGECVSYFSKGGFGNWGLLIGGNIECVVKWTRNTKGIVHPCNWTGASDIQKFTPQLTKPLFLEPMK